MRSMTGYGQANWQRGGRTLGVEIRSVNQRFLEVRLNLPREYSPWEAELRSLVQENVSRGKVDVALNRGGAANTVVSVEANTALAKAYVAAWRDLQRDLGLKHEPDLTPLLGRAEMFRVVERRAESEDEIDIAKSTLLRAIQAFNRDREREGKALGADIAARARRLLTLQQAISKRVAVLKPEYASRLRQRVAALLAGNPVSEERLLQEVTLVVERSDVTEELVRLESHLKALAQLPRSKEPSGKRFDFLLQEIHREFNTIASKSADLDVTNHTIEARGEIEKLREQVQNVE